MESSKDIGRAVFWICTIRRKIYSCLAKRLRSTHKQNRHPLIPVFTLGTTIITSGEWSLSENRYLDPPSLLPLFVAAVAEPSYRRYTSCSILWLTLLLNHWCYRELFVIQLASLKSQAVQRIADILKTHALFLSHSGFLGTRHLCYVHTCRDTVFSNRHLFKIVFDKSLPKRGWRGNPYIQVKA